MSMFVLPILVAFAVSCLMTVYLASPGAKLRVVDHPNERSLHERPTPRTGGLAVLVGAAVAVVWFSLSMDAGSELLWIGAGALAVAMVSFLDDHLDVPVVLRLAVHLAAAIVLLAGGLQIDQLALPGVAWSLSVPLGMLLTIGYVVWLINLYNFMDGMDGLAGGMAAIGFAALGALGWMHDELLFAATCWAVSAGALGFLVWNFPPARIFMGDTGSSTLGFLAAACSIWADQNQVAPIWVSVLVFSPFIVDATITLLRRMFRGDVLWKAHRSHYYQRLAMAGWGHRRTVLWEYLVMVACAASAILAAQVAYGAPWAWLAVFGWTIAYIVLSFVADRRAPYGTEDVTCQGS